MNYYLTIAGILFAYMTCWFLVSILKKRNDIADIAWGLGFILITWSSWIISGMYSSRGLLVGMLVSIWGIRLALHIYSRNNGKTEDFRYLTWRRQWGAWFYVRSYLQVYLLQGFFLYVIISPILYINHNTGGQLGITDVIGVLIWIIGFFFESVGDAQLTDFIKNPANKGKIMKTGLWKYTRHPNYFGEVVLWWGIWLIAASMPQGYITIFGPITITWLILFVSGIPMLEKKYESNPEFEAYKKETSAFIPLPPRK